MDNDYDAGVKAGLSAAAFLLEEEAETVTLKTARLSAGHPELEPVRQAAQVLLRKVAAEIRTLKITRGRR